MREREESGGEGERMREDEISIEQWDSEEVFITKFWRTLNFCK